MNESKVNELLNAFIEKPIRLTYSSSSLQKQYKIGLVEIQEAKKQYKKTLCKTEIFKKKVILPKSLYRPNKESNTLKLKDSIEHSIKTQQDGSIEVEIQENSQVNDPKELLRLVNLNPEEFEVMSFWRGFRRDKWWASVKARPVRSGNPGGLDYLKAFKESLNDYRGPSSSITYNQKENEKMAVVCLFDIHLGKIGIWDYTGDFDITVGEVRAEFEKLYHFLSTQEINKILLPIGNDFFHMDDSRMSTTAGTPLEGNYNLYRTFKQGLNLMRYMIERLSGLAPVEVVLVAGNHANYTETILATSLSAIFKNCDGITIDDTPKDRKYIKYGKNLIGLTHGVLKPEKYAELLPFEAKEYFSSCDHFEILVGDKHHEKVYKNPVIETGGVVVRQLGALSRKDIWHDKKGYVLAKRRSYVLIYDKKNGLDLQYTNTVNE